MFQGFPEQHVETLMFWVGVSVACGWTFCADSQLVTASSLVFPTGLALYGPQENARWKETQLSACELVSCLKSQKLVTELRYPSWAPCALILPSSGGARRQEVVCDEVTLSAIQAAKQVVVSWRKD